MNNIAEIEMMKCNDLESLLPPTCLCITNKETATAKTNIMYKSK